MYRPVVGVTVELLVAIVVVSTEPFGDDVAVDEPGVADHHVREWSDY